MPIRQIAQLPWPMKGLVENAAFSQPGDSTTLDCLNVRPYDSLKKKLRGGQRTGISKYLASQVNSDNPVQAIGSLVQAFDPSTIIAGTVLKNVSFTDNGSDQAIQDFDSDFANYEGGSYFDAAATGNNGMTVFDPYGAAAYSTGGTQRSGAVYNPTDLGSAYIVRITFKAGNASNFANVGLVFRCAADPTDRNFYAIRVDAATTIRFITYAAGTPSVLQTISVSSMAIDTTHTLEVHVNGTTAKVYLNDVKIGSDETLSAHSGNTRTGIISERATTFTNQSRIESFYVARGTQPASLRTTSLFAVAGGSIFKGSKDDGLSAVSGGSSALIDSGPIRMVPAFSKMFFCDGRAAGYVYYDNDTNAITDWATDVTAGALPVGSVDSTKACRIAALYRGRIALAGLSEEPQNWFMSVSGDPFDWDYSPATTSATQAVAGNSSDVGELGDIVTALAPFNDDVMIMGGDHTLWIMRGDPAAGGAIDNISRQVGIVQPTAWTWDAFGNLYFFGNNGLYRLPMNSATPELVSRNRLDKTFSEIDVAANYITVLYDREWQGIHIFITPINQPTTGSYCYFWDERTDSFWRDQYPAALGPTASHLFDADDPDDRAVLLGGFDGYIRNFDAATSNDDGTAIVSRCRLPIVQPGQSLASSRMDELTILTDEDGDPVTLSIYTGHSAEDAVAQADAGTAARFTKILPAGRALTMRPRIAQNAFAFTLANSVAGQTWAYETGSAVLATLNRMHYKKV